MIAVQLATFEIDARGFRWLDVNTRDAREQAALLDVIMGIEAREAEEVP